MSSTRHPLVRSSSRAFGARSSHTRFAGSVKVGHASPARRLLASSARATPLVSSDLPSHSGRPLLPLDRRASGPEVGAPLVTSLLLTVARKRVTGGGRRASL